MTIKQYAFQSGLHPETVRNYIKIGKIDAEKHGIVFRSHSYKKRPDVIYEHGQECWSVKKVIDVLKSNTSAINRLIARGGLNVTRLHGKRFIIKDEKFNAYLKTLEKQGFTVDEYAKFKKVSKEVIYKKLKEGEIQAKKGRYGWNIFDNKHNREWKYTHSLTYDRIREIDGKKYATTDYFAKLWDEPFQVAYSRLRTTLYKDYRLERKSGNRKIMFTEINDFTIQPIPDDRPETLTCPNGIEVYNNCMGQVMALGDTVYESVIDIPEYKFIASNKHRKSD